jgi:hypothetical protein
MNVRTLFLTLAVAAAGFFATTHAALAEAKSVYHGGTYWGSIIVPHDQVVDGDLDVMFGNATIEGTVNGNVNVLGGYHIERNGGVINGQAHQFGGEIVQNIVPWAPDEDGNTFFVGDTHLWWRIMWNVVILVFFLIFPMRARMAVDRLEHYPAISAVFGLLGWLAIPVLAFIMFCTIVLWPLIPIELILVTAATFIGIAALALLIGRRFYELVSPRTTPSPLVALILGLTLVTAAEMVPVVGFFVTGLAALIGFGAVILTFVSGMQAGGPAAPLPRAPIGGPPMPVG